MTNYSFWKLINEHRIEIPIIQRDYAQGRDTQKSKEVRTSFVKNIVKVTNEGIGNLHLNFVYGKVRGRKDIKQIEENKKAIVSMLKAVKGYSRSLELDFAYQWDDSNSQHNEINTTSFLPLDGQQRLTTLFLFHWYLLKQIDVEQDSVNKLLNFTYQIRPSTKQFCKELVLQELEIDVSKTVSSVIEDSNWFFKYWLKDPSVKGMLIMLDEIHKQCMSLSQVDYVRMWKNISENNAINFELLDLDEFELTDELYVKMNARGKALTSFENFKSWLMEYIEDNSIQINISQWKHKLDASWADIFWDNKDGENMLIDEEYFVYFRNMMQFHYILNHTVDIKTDDGKVNRDIASILAPARKKKKDSDYYFEYPVVPVSHIKEYGVLTEVSLNETFKLLDIISYYQTQNDKSIYEVIQPIFTKFITGNITMPDKVIFYGLGQYLLCNDSINKRDLEAFLRVLSNLTNNTEIDDISIVKSIIKGFIEDAKHYNNLGSVVDKKLNFAGFRTDQVREEKLKILLRLNEDVEWTQLLDEAESHKYFQGQIGFLLHLSGVDSYYSKHFNVSFNPKENDDLKESFRKYLVVAQQTFRDVDVDKDIDKLLYRALLTYGDYLIPHASYRSFPKPDKHRDNSWYRFMREFKQESKYNDIWKVLEQLFDDLISGKTLHEIIEDVPTDWRECFVRYPETIEKCGKYLHFRVEGGNIYLLSKDTKRSNYTELETFHLLKSKFEQHMNDYVPFQKYDYWIGNTKNGEPCVFLNGYEIDGLEITMNIYHYGNKEFPWEINIAIDDGDISTLRKHLDPVLINNNFTFEAESSEYDLPVYILKQSGDIHSINDTIKQICSGFNQVVLEGV